MLNVLIKYGKKVLLVLIFTAMLIARGTIVSHADYSENTERDVDIVVRAGEWQNMFEAKPGKRYEWGKDINISDHGLTLDDIPNDIPIRKDVETGTFFISEADINLKTARVLAHKLSKMGVDVDLQYSTNKSEDLNAAGRMADKKNPSIYVSIHHNSWKEDTEGYFFMYNEGDYNSSRIASRLNEALRYNGYVPQKKNRVNDGYIGELNHVYKSGRICVLGELGFFSNPNELKYIMSDEYVDVVTTNMARELYNTLIEMNTHSCTTLQETYEQIQSKAREVLKYIL